MNNNRSYFWPLLLIGAGALILLANLGIFEMASLYQLANLWPLLLVGIGVQMMFGRDNKWIGLAIGVTMLALIAIFLIFAPQLDLPNSFGGKALQSENFTEVMGDTELVTLNVDTDRGNLTVSANPDANELVYVDMKHRSESYFNVSGSDHKEITLRLDDGPFSFSPADWLSDEQPYIDISLNSTVPTDIQVDHSAGNVDLYLSEFDLTNLDAKLSSGNMDVVLPSGSYPTKLMVSSGNMNVELPEDSIAHLEADVSSGNITIDLGNGVYGSLDLHVSSGNITLNIPAGLGIQVEGQISSGSANIPNSFREVSSDDKLVGVDGIWESDNFNTAEQTLIITFYISSGNFRINIVN